MSDELFNFHLKCKDEYTQLLKSFNILFYGFGSKKSILNRLFHHSTIFDMHYLSMADVLDTLNSHYNTKYKTIQELDKAISTGAHDTTLNTSGIISNTNNYESIVNNSDTAMYTHSNILILIDFDFKYTYLIKNLTFFRLIVTLEQIDMEIREDDLIALNVVMRDLTTYETYDVDVMPQANSVFDDYINIIRNVSKNAKYVFKELLSYRRENVSANELFDRIKRPLLLFNKCSVYKLLTEFIDHKMIKLDDDQIINILINKKHFDALIQECNNE